MLGIKPKLNELQLLKFPDGDKLRIIDTVASKWMQVAIALGLEGPKIEAIEMGAHYQPGDACLKTFIDRLSRGHDFTWNSLIQSLTAANLVEIANLLSCKIEIVSFTHIAIDEVATVCYKMPCSSCINVQPEETEDASSVLTTIAADTESRIESSPTTHATINNEVKGISVVFPLDWIIIYDIHCTLNQFCEYLYVCIYS